MKILIGNDIVDLTNPDIDQKHLQKRFINRVLSRDELELLRNSPDQKKMLWILWSGKESAYKVLKKLIPSMVFSHSNISVSFDSRSLQGSVCFQNYHLSLRWIITNKWVHCLALLSKDETIRNEFIS